MFDCLGRFFEDLVEQIAQFGCLPEKQNQMFVVSSFRLEILDCSSVVFFCGLPTVIKTDVIFSFCGWLV